MTDARCKPYGNIHPEGRPCADCAMTDTPTTAAWGAMLEDTIGLWGVGQPDKDDVLDVLAEARPLVEQEAVTRALDALAVEVRKWTPSGPGNVETLHRDTVLALIEQAKGAER